jgi:PTS system nitrogen regulatory IIA component
MNLSDILQAEDVILGVSAPSKAALVRLLARHAAARLDLAEAEIFRALDNREKLGSTGIGSGFAIPHAEIEQILEPFGMLAILKRPIDFEALDDEPVDVALVVLAPLGRTSAHLNILACFARQARMKMFRAKLRAATSPSAAYSVLMERTE